MKAVSPENGLRKGNRTRLAILQAARDQFHELGYAQASIRAIAAKAHIDPSMVMRYYGNKEGLFVAAIDIDLRIPDLEKWPPGRRGQKLVEHFLARWEGNRHDDVLVILLRSAMTNEIAVARMQAIFVDQLLAIVTIGETDAEAQRRAGLIATQMLGLALTRYILRLPGIVGRSAEELAGDLGPTIQRYLMGKLPALACPST